MKNIRILFVISLSLLVFSLAINLRYPRKDVSSIQDGGSAFHGESVGDPLMQVGEDEIVQIQDDGYEFYAISPQKEGSAVVSFLYQCDPECKDIWMTYPAVVGNDVEVKMLVHHPIIDQLDWFYIQDRGATFYQAEVAYSTIDKFMLGNSEPYLTEMFLATAAGFLSENVSYLDDQDKLRREMFVITSRGPYGQFRGWYTYFKSISMKTVLVDENGKVKFRIKKGNQKDYELRIARLSVE